MKIIYNTAYEQNDNNRMYIFSIYKIWRQVWSHESLAKQIIQMNSNQASWWFLNFILKKKQTNNFCFRPRFSFWDENHQGQGHGCSSKPTCTFHTDVTDLQNAQLPKREPAMPPSYRPNP